MNKKQQFVWYKNGLGSVVVCIFIALLFSYTDIFSGFNQAWIDRDIRDHGLQGAVYFIALAAVLTGCGAPRQLVAFLGGYAFGFVFGVVFATLATLLGCFIAFYASRFLVRPIVCKRFKRQVDYVDRFLLQTPIYKTIIIRLLPVGSNFLTNIFAGATSVRASAFFIGSAIGYVPQMVIFALLGKGLFIGSEWKIALSVSMLLISSYMSISIYRKYRREDAAITKLHEDASAQSKFEN